MVLVLVYSVAIAHGGRSDGVATLCYPFSLLQPAAERLGRAGWEHRPIVNLDGDASAAETMRAHLADVDVDVSVTLRPSTITAAELAGIQPGDVIRLEHRVDEPVVGRLETPRSSRLGRQARPSPSDQILEWKSNDRQDRHLAAEETSPTPRSRTRQRVRIGDLRDIAVLGDVRLDVTVS